jgi:hypothetical protein
MFARAPGRRALDMVTTAATLAVLPLILLALTVLIDWRTSPELESPLDLFRPDKLGASTAMILIGTAEGVAIAIVIVVVVVGVQMSADRYSPRIIEIFVRDRMNTAVIGLFLGSMLYTVWVSIEIKDEYVPQAGVFTAALLAFVDFTLLLPYLRHLFGFMRGEVVIATIHHRAARLLREVATDGDLSARHQVALAVDQITDIALGSIQEGDAEVGLAAIDSLCQLMVLEYIPLKKKYPTLWFRVGHYDLAGASDQIIADTDASHTWVEYKILSRFVDLIGEVQPYRKEVIRNIARATRDMGMAALRYGDEELLQLVIRYFNTFLRASINQRAAPLGYAAMNEYRRLAESLAEERPDVALAIAAYVIQYGRGFDAAGMPFALPTAYEDVSELVVAAKDPAHSQDLAKVLADNLGGMRAVASPVAQKGALNSALKTCLWAAANGRQDVLATLLGGVSKMPAEWSSELLDRMQSSDRKVFWEVSDRVVAYEYVEPELRAGIKELKQRTTATAGAAGA